MLQKELGAKRRVQVPLSSSQSVNPERVQKEKIEGQGYCQNMHQSLDSPYSGIHTASTRHIHLPLAIESTRRDAKTKIKILAMLLCLIFEPAI